MIGGGAVATASIDDQAGSKSSPTHGAWARTGNRSFKITAHAFSFDDSGKLNGLFNIQERDTLSKDGMTYTGAGSFEVVNGPGAFPATPYTSTAARNKA